MRSLVLLALVAVLAAGCGSDSEDEHGAASGIRDGSHEVGVDVDPGVYTAALGCVGSITLKAGPLDGPGSDPDNFAGGSLQVGNVQRVALKKGQFFTSQVCPSGWKRESATGPVTPDPATRAGACAILLGPGGQVAAALEVLPKASAGEDQRVGEVQERLMAVVFSHTKGLWSHAGEFVDFLDAPDAFVTDGKVEPRVTRAVTAIRRACARG